MGTCISTVSHPPGVKSDIPEKRMVFSLLRSKSSCLLYAFLQWGKIDSLSTCGDSLLDLKNVLNQRPRSLRNWPPDCQILTKDWLGHISKWGLSTSLHNAFLPILWANFSTRCGDFKVPILRSKSLRGSSNHRHKWGAFEVLYHLCISNERLFYTEKCNW